MTCQPRMTGRLVSAGRALAGVGRTHLATAAGMSVDRLRMLESAGSAWIQSEEDAAAICRALAHFGIVIIDESDGLGAGVRLKFTRQDVKQLVRLEGEGGIIASDDAP